MSVKLNRPPKPEESQKDSKIQTSTEKTIPYPGFEPGTSGLAVSSHTTAPLGRFSVWSIALVRRINFVGKLRSDIPT
jgi:hypothetical protein